MLISDMHFSDEASRKLSQMKGRTGLTPNILARIGFCLSLENPVIPNPDDYDSMGYINIKWHVLTGSYAPMFTALIKERCDQDQIDFEQLQAQFRAHMNRGIILLNKKLKSLDGLLLMVAPELRNVQETA